MTAIDTSTEAVERLTKECDEARAALAASQPADPVTNDSYFQPVRVKPLVWELTKHVAPVQNGHRATGAGIHYTIISDRGNGKCLLSSHGAAFIGPIQHSNVEAAKAAAQADYEGRILAALEPAPHVNETPKSEHDSADVLTALRAPVTLAEAARIVGKAINKGHEPFRLAVNAASREINCDGHVASVARVALALEAALRAIGEGEA